MSAEAYELNQSRATELAEQIRLHDALNTDQALTLAGIYSQLAQNELAALALDGINSPDDEQPEELN